MRAKFINIGKIVSIQVIIYSAEIFMNFIFRIYKIEMSFRIMVEKKK